MKIKSETHNLWRVVDYEGEVLESYATKIHDKKALGGVDKFHALGAHRSEAPNRAADCDTQDYVEEEKQQPNVETAGEPKPLRGRIAHF